MNIIFKIMCGFLSAICHHNKKMILKFDGQQYQVLALYKHDYVY